ncbi:MAG: U32 family peptidase [Cyclobacteriaceae bacterium]|nr:U32 family peptidase [Cyclobacteriaceae bacterium]
MAPAGDFEMLTAAIQGGANAIYFGVGKLNMRSGSAKNFIAGDLPAIVAKCHAFKLKACLTLNTVIYDAEIEEAKSLLCQARDAGIDAIIASDPAVIEMSHNMGLPVHISTQANISNIESVRFYSRYADVMVLARELSLQQTLDIAKSIEAQHITGPSGKLVKLEIFIHGALCMAISGKCYLSLHQANVSANRGKCRQICRRSYEVADNDTGEKLVIDNEYIMSPKDLCTIEFFDQLVSAGVSILKIEGRGRSPEYVKTVTQCYHEALIALEEGTFTVEKTEMWKKQLEEVYNRGFWDGYYLGRKTGEWSQNYGSNATTRKIYIGKGTNYFKKPGVAEFLIESRHINVGDRVLVTGPTTGVMEFIIPEIRVNLQPAQKSVKGEFCSIPVPTKVRRADKLYKIESVTEMKEIF